ncbi:unnamed protein product [Peniophora sp. CBMAI 1063]|nr:unnamed protein product [Peniophora sp. CBMAI 1063]
MDWDSLTPQRLQVLEQFKKQVQEEQLLKDEQHLASFDDYHLARFLRARAYNLKDAHTMLVACLEWRRTVEGKGLATLYKEMDPFDFPERKHVSQHWPMYFHKTDKFGRPVNIQAFGSINVNELFKGISPERHWQSIVVNAEALIAEVLPAVSTERAQHIEQVMVIIDLKGFSLSQFWQMKSLVQRALYASQNYYPETMGKLVIINAPVTFAAIWKIIKPLIHERTVSKVEIYSSSYKDALLSQIPAENLPASLGGKCSCPGGCSNAGPWMDGRAERRAQWIAGEQARPGLPWVGEDVDLVAQSKAYHVGTIQLDEAEIEAVKAQQSQTASAVPVSA